MQSAAGRQGMEEDHQEEGQQEATAEDVYDSGRLQLLLLINRK
jgi:hypothetical protein